MNFPSALLFLFPLAAALAQFVVEDDEPEEETLKFKGTAAVATVDAAIAKPPLLSSTGVAGALTLPLPSRTFRAAAGGASKRFRISRR